MKNIYVEQSQITFESTKSHLNDLNNEIFAQVNRFAENTNQ